MAFNNPDAVLPDARLYAAVSRAAPWLADQDADLVKETDPGEYEKRRPLCNGPACDQPSY